MKLYSKDGTSFKILVSPNEEIHKGEYLLIKDPGKNFSYLIQVIDINYLDIPGLVEELVREELMLRNGEDDMDPLNTVDMLTALRDIRMLDCEVRGIMRGGSVLRGFIDLPSRSKSFIRKIPSSKVLEAVSCKGNRKILIGRDIEGFDVFINAEDLDGSLTLITGMKGTGKSHLAKLLVLGLAEKGAPVMVLDINGEYVGLAERNDGKINVYYPGLNLSFSPSYLGKHVILDVMTNVLNLPGVSANFFNDIWPLIEAKGKVKLKTIENIVKMSTTNMMVKDALLSRLMTLKLCGFVSDEGTGCIENLITPGRASIIVLRDLPPLNRRILVEIILSKLVSLLLHERISPFFLFAEEAHLYVRQTYWEDIITRMRHFGLFVTFITNQLESLDQKIFKQLDNVFLFCFKNEGDLDRISRISDVDTRTIKMMVKDLPIGVCLAVGKVVSFMPLIVSVRDIDGKALGETKLVFKKPRTASTVRGLPSARM